MRISTMNPRAASASAAACRHVSAPPAFISNLRTAAATAAISLTLLTGSVHPAQAAQFSSLADVMRPTFEFVDTNKDGIVTLEELKQLSTQVIYREAIHKWGDWVGGASLHECMATAHRAESYLRRFITSFIPPLDLPSRYLHPHTAGLRGGGYGTALGGAAGLHAAPV